MTVHRIRLRGPWQLAPAAASEAQTTTVRLPAPWSELFDGDAARMRLSRRFHRPTNLGPTDQVSLVVRPLPLGARVSLNGTILDLQPDCGSDQAVFPAPRLELSNVLAVEFDAFRAVGDQPGIEVALLITSP
jgi:hypothetical protein